MSKVKIEDGKTYSSVEEMLEDLYKEDELERKNKPISYNLKKLWHRINLSQRYYNTKNGVKNLIKWFPIVWRDRDWDEAYLLTVMEFKFKNMSHLHKNYGHLENSELYASQLARAAELTERIKNDRLHYSEEVEVLHNQGKIREAMELEHELYTKDLDELTTLIKENLHHWWD